MKVPKTYSIDDDIYKSFEILTNKLNVNKSSFIEDKIKEFLKENGISDYKTYFLVSDPSYEITIVGQDDNFVYLSDDSKIPKQIFNQAYKPLEKLDPIDPINFFRYDPIIIKFLLPNIEKTNLMLRIKEIKDSYSNILSKKLTGKKFKNSTDGRIYRVLEDNNTWVSIIPDDINPDLDLIQMKNSTLNIKRDAFLEKYKLSDDKIFIGIGDFALEYLDESRIDGAPFFKLGGGIFYQFFNSDKSKLREYILNNQNITIGLDKLFLNTNDIIFIPMLSGNVNEWVNESWKERGAGWIHDGVSNNTANWDSDRIIIEKALKDSVNTDIKATSFVSDLPQNEKNKYEKMLEDLPKNDIDKQISFIQTVLYEFDKGDFKSEFTASNKIRTFLKNLDVIKISDANSKISKLKYDLLHKIAEYYNTFC